MRFKVIAALVVAAALMGTSAGVALATSRTSHAKTGMEHYWVSNFIPKTGNPTVFIGTGFFTDAGKLANTSSGKTTLSKGGFLIDSSNATPKFTFNTHTCFISATFSGSISLHGGTGAYKGISGKLSISGKILGVNPRLKNGKCNEAQNAVPLELLGVLSGSGKVTLGK